MAKSTPKLRVLRSRDGEPFPSPHAPRVGHTPAETGKALRVARRFAKLSVAGLAEASGVEPSVVAEVEDGCRSVSIRLAERLGKALAVHPSLLVWPRWEP